jgi:hypothetical protein
MKYVCVSDLYSPSDEDTYDSIEDFLEMCDYCFSETPSLRYDQLTGNGYSDSPDTLGQLILLRVS